MKTLKNICTEYSTPTLTVSIGIFIYVQNQYTKDRKRRKIVENFRHYVEVVFFLYHTRNGANTQCGRKQ